MNLSDAIRQKRKRENLSAKGLAEKLNVKVENLYKWEKGTKPTDPEDYLKVTGWLNEKMENVPESKEIKEEPGTMQDDNYTRLMRSMENLTEDKIRSTAIIERLVALLEQGFSYGQTAALIPPVHLYN